MNESRENEPGMVQQAIQTSQQGLESIKNTATDLAAQTQNAVENVREKVSDTMGDFSSTNAVDASREFLDSNTIIAKIGFIILVLIIFFITLRICMMMMSYFLSPSATPYLVSGMVPGNNTIVISQNPQSTESVNILRSNNQTTGVEFTWSVWLLVKPSTSSPTSPFQNVFTKGDGFFGNPDNNNNGITMVDNGPGLYLIHDMSGNDTNNPTYTGVMKLIGIMDVFNPSPSPYVIDGHSINSPYVVANNIPIGKWFHVALRLENTLLDLYVNGVLSARTILQDVPKQNYGDVTVCGNNGFNGQLSNLRYYNYALNVFQIGSIAWWGPSTSSVTSALQANNGYTYLSSAWYNNNI